MRELSIIEDGALLVRDGLIVALGATSEVAAAGKPNAARIDAGGRGDAGIR